MWLDDVQNIAVSEKTGLNGQSLIIADRRHSLFDHICRRSHQAPAHQALQLCIDASSGTRLEMSTWPTTLKWLKQVKEDLGQPVSSGSVATYFGCRPKVVAV